MNNTNKSTLDPKEDIEYRIDLAEYYIRRFEGRREFEWKVTIGLWGAILGSAAVLSDYAGKLPLRITAILALAILFGHYIWLRYTWRAHRIDKNAAFSFSRSAADKLGVDLDPYKPVTFLKLPPAMSFQLYITLLLVIMATLFFSCSLA